MDLRSLSSSLNNPSNHSLAALALEARLLHLQHLLLQNHLSSALHLAQALVSPRLQDSEDLEALQGQANNSSSSQVNSLQLLRACLAASSQQHQQQAVALEVA